MTTCGVCTVEIKDFQAKVEYEGKLFHRLCCELGFMIMKTQNKELLEELKDVPFYKKIKELWDKGARV